MRNSVILATLALVPAFAQELPSWLETYPGATASVQSSGGLIQSSYTIDAQPEAIIALYRKMFEGAGLSFRPNSDGIGTSIRAQAPECDLLIQIRSRSQGSSVNVNCSARTESTTVAALPDVKMTSSRPQSMRGSAAPSAPQIPADWMAEHKRKVEELGIHREYHDAPAPPLVWPSWLVQVNGSVMRTERGVDQSKNDILKARFVTNAPMTEIYNFYRDLLNAHEYPARSSLRTGQTMTGVQQNAFGSVEGYNYPDGAPGAYSIINIRFDRSVLNGPITVSMQFIPHEFIAKRGY